MTKFAINFAVVLIAASSAFAQLDPSALRSKYGAPGDRETFTVRPGIEMIADYGPSKQVCRIQLSSGKQMVGTVPPGVVTRQQIDEIVNEVVPPAIRGNEVNRGMMAFGPLMRLFTYYEHVTVSESKDGAIGTGITVAFKDATCPKYNPGLPQ